MAQSPVGVNFDFLLRRPSAILESQFEDAILSIGNAMSAMEFRETVDTGLHLALLNVKHSLVFLLDLETNELSYFHSTTEVYPMPRAGVVWEVVRRRTPDISRAGIPENDPIRTLFPTLGRLERDQVVVLFPIVDKKQTRVIAFLLAVCEELSLIHQDRLRWLERNVVVAASRVLKHMAAERERMRAEGMLKVCANRIFGMAECKWNVSVYSSVKRDLIDLDTPSLSIKILKHLKFILEAELCLLLVHDDATNELVCQVFDETPLDKEIRKPIPESIYGRCFLTGEVLNITDISKDMRFNPEIDLVEDYEPSTMLCMPVKVQREEGHAAGAIAVAVACNKKGKKPFSSRDEDNMWFVLRFSASVLANTLVYQREQVLKKQNEALLQVTRNLFTNMNDLDVLLREIMNEARSLTDSERCSLFLLDPKQQELVAVVFDSDLPSEEEPLRIAVGQGIAGFVAKTGKIVNIKDAYKHPKFFKDVDKSTGFHTRNILCFPIKNNNGEVIGVAELCNKIKGRFFTKYDEELATTFSVYCGISIIYSKLYGDMLESQGRSKVATELMIYHMKITEEEVERIVSRKIQPCSAFHQRMSELTFSPRVVPEGDSITAVLSMMDEMGLIRRWKLQTDTLGRFLLMVKKGYRITPYHNWFHAFSVAHFCYALYQTCDRLSFLSNIEILALLVSCLCHDIDHRGTNNAFQISSNSVLASLYSSEGSVMERHHFSQTLSILNSEGCNIFKRLSPEDYKRVLDLIHHNILDTDIASHLRKFKDITHMGKVGYDPKKQEHHELMCSLIMTSCDLSANCKNWESSKAISDLIYQEFFSQGDLEKALGVTPSEMMDRERAFIPELQLGFVDGIAGPLYKVLVDVLPATSMVYEALQSNRRKWVELKKEGRRPSVDITELPDPIV